MLLVLFLDLLKEYPPNLGFLDAPNATVFNFGGDSTNGALTYVGAEFI